MAGRSFASEKEMKVQISKRIFDWHLATKSVMINCSICNSKLRAYSSDYPMYNNLRQHAEIHLAKSIFGCGHCRVRELTTSGLCQHLLEDHKLPLIEGNYRPLSKTQCHELTKMIMECFFTEGSEEEERNAKETPEGKPGPSRAQSKSKIPETSRSSLSHFDLKILIANSESIHCHLCKKDVTLVDDKAEEDALNHAANHIGKSLYYCRTCPRRFRHLNCVKLHLETVHKMKKVTKNMYDDLRQECYADLKSVVSICYSRSEVRMERMKMDDESNFEESMTRTEEDEDSDSEDGEKEDDEKEDETEEEDGIEDDDGQDSLEESDGDKENENFIGDKDVEASDASEDDESFQMYGILKRPNGKDPLQISESCNNQ